MKKVTSSLAIVSTVLMVLAFLLQITLYGIDVLFARVFLNQIPNYATNLICSAATLCCMASMIFLARRERGGIGIELGLLGIMAVVVPIASIVITLVTSIVTSIILSYIPPSKLYIEGLFRNMEGIYDSWLFVQLERIIPSAYRLLNMAAKMLAAAVLGMSMAIRIYDKKQKKRRARAV